MKTSGKGALARQTIVEMIDAGCIKGVTDTGNVQPASLDLSLADEAWLINASVLPRTTDTIRDLLGIFDRKRFNFNQPLGVGECLLVRLQETLDLPDEVYAYANPKSSTGRIDLHVRMLSDRFPRYDGACVGYKGDLWMTIIPKSFPVKLEPGLTLNQMRFLNLDTRFDQLTLELVHRQSPLVWNVETAEPIGWSELSTFDKDGSIILHAGLSTEVVGWVAKDTEEILDLTRRDYDPEKFFEEVVPHNGHVTLEQGRFYIISTWEGVRVPPEIASEIAPIDERSGDFRSHYAGFFDPGWGFGETGEGRGDTATLEVRPFETILLRHLQPIARFKFEMMAHVPDVVYASAGSHYGGQKGPGLSKYFKR